MISKRLSISGMNTVYDIADYFNLSTNTVEFAYNYYKENGYL